jgi:hypothetical protein
MRKLESENEIWRIGDNHRKLSSAKKRLKIWLKEKAENEREMKSAVEERKYGVMAEGVNGEIINHANLKAA